MSDDEWSEGSHGYYLSRDNYDAHGDNWAYIDTKTLTIVDYRPEKEDSAKMGVGVVVSGPFPSLKAAKAAFLVIYGGSNG